MDTWDPTPSSGRVSWPPVVAPPESVVELRWRRGHGHQRLRWVWGTATNTTVGTTGAQRHRSVAVHGEVARRWRYLSPASNCAYARAGKGKSGSGVGWLPQERAPGPSNGGRDTVRPRVHGGETLAARRRSDERGQREIEREGANRGVS